MSYEYATSTPLVSSGVGGRAAPGAAVQKSPPRDPAHFPPGSGLPTGGRIETLDLQSSMHAHAQRHHVHGPPPSMRGPLSSAEEVDPTGGPWVKLRDLDTTDRQVLEGLHNLFNARTMDEHVMAMDRFLDADVKWDNPLFIAHGRDAVRCILYIAKFLGYIDFHPLVVRSVDAGEGRHRLEMLADVQVAPMKQWWLPPTWLLPNILHLKGLIKMGISQLGVGAPGKVSLLWARPVNLPALPTLLRLLNGSLLGAATHWTEPVWSQFMQVLGDDSYTHGHGMKSATRDDEYGITGRRDAPGVMHQRGTTAPGATSPAGKML